jgi:phenazine biosynthesis protein phzE
MSGLGHDAVKRVLDGGDEAFAMLHRPERTDRATLEILFGTPSTATALGDLPLPVGPTGDEGEERHDLLAVIPYRQLAERGFAAPDDGAPLLTLAVTEQYSAPADALLSRLPERELSLDNAGFDTTDEEYAATVRRVVEDEIGEGAGSNFVLRRSFTAEIRDYTRADALALFARLLRHERGAYWTFLIHFGDRTFVGASPERHISVHRGRAVMNPVSGTYRYPAAGPTLAGVRDFLADPKERDELYMVVDEELKMMARICGPGLRVKGPRLKEMGRLAHTEYLIEGHTDSDPRDVLRETLFAPTVTGAPLESAAQVIARYEPEGRGYYSGVAALIGRDGLGARTLDSAILIRTADLDAQGRLGIGVGATLVRHSDPWSEVAETRAKTAALLEPAYPAEPAGFSGHPAVRAALARRNSNVAGFWLRPPPAPPYGHHPALSGRSALLVDAEDTFTSMLALQLDSLGLSCTVRRHDEPYDLGAYDLVVMGPGPGDPREVHRPKIARLRADLARLVDERRPFLAVCLSHQVLSTLLGLQLGRRPVPNQGTQRTIDLFGEPQRVGFYNTFAAHSDTDRVHGPTGVVEVGRDPDTGDVHALRGPGFASTQFHPESFLTENGPAVLQAALAHALRSTSAVRDAA